MSDVFKCFFFYYSSCTDLKVTKPLFSEKKYVRIKFRNTHKNMHTPHTHTHTHIYIYIYIYIYIVCVCVCMYVSVD